MLNECRNGSVNSMDNTIKKNNKVIETVNYNGKYIDVNTVRNKVISIGGIALVALAASFFAIFLF